MIQKKREITKLFDIGYFCDKCGTQMRLVQSAISLSQNDQQPNLIWQCPNCYLSAPITENCMPGAQEAEFGEWIEIEEESSESSITL